MHAGGDPEELDGMLGRLAALRAEYGRQNEPFEIHAMAMGEVSADDLRRLEDKGVTDLILPIRNPYEADSMTLNQKLAAIRGLGEQLLSR